uniref:Uncharacterized protein n=1 Tax=Brugia malayi TaxID=6279 RepID=A8QDQ1_BRUMA
MPQQIFGLLFVDKSNNREKGNEKKKTMISDFFFFLVFDRKTESKKLKNIVC